MNTYEKCDTIRRIILNTAANEIDSVRSEWQKAMLKYKKRLVSLYDKHDELIDKLHELPLRELVKVLTALSISGRLTKNEEAALAHVGYALKALAEQREKDDE